MPESKQKFLTKFVGYFVAGFFFFAALGCLGISLISGVYIPWQCSLALAVCAVFWLPPVDAPLVAARIPVVLVAAIARWIAADYWHQGTGGLRLPTFALIYLKSIG